MTKPAPTGPSMRLRLILLLLVVGLVAAWLYSRPTAVETGESIPPAEGSPRPSLPDSQPASPWADAEAVIARLAAALPDPHFIDATESAGLDYVHTTTPELWLARTELEVPMGIEGGGVAAADFDGDGFTDLYFAGVERGRLYRNLDGRKLQDVTEAVNLGRATWGETRAGYFIDYDNDGDLDLYLTFAAAPNRLLENDGSGRFSDATPRLGFPPDRLVTHEAVWADVNNDGLLDVYTASFGNWPIGQSPVLRSDNQNAPPNRLFIQRFESGVRRFVESAGERGVADPGWTHCVAAFDFDEDGLADLFALNDFGTSGVYRNNEGRGFTPVVREVGMTDLANAMSFSVVDLGPGARAAIYVSQIPDMLPPGVGAPPAALNRLTTRRGRRGPSEALVANRLYAFEPATGRFVDQHVDRIQPVDLGWAWDAHFFDYENDGDLDLLVLNGTDDRIPQLDDESRPGHIRGREYLGFFADEPNAFLLNEGERLYDLSRHSPLAYRGNSRSAAAFDFDNDGDLDLAINDYEAPARLLLNNSPPTNRWVRFRLVGRSSNRQAIGAVVTIHAGNLQRSGYLASRIGFLAQDPPILHFGLGAAESVDRVEVRWPSGITQGLENLSAGTTHTITEPDRNGDPPTGNP